MSSTSFTSDADKSMSEPHVTLTETQSDRTTSDPKATETNNPESHDDLEGNEPGASKKKKHSLLDDDFFSLAGSFDHKRKKKHKHKHKHDKGKENSKDELLPFLFGDQPWSGTKTDEDENEDILGNLTKMRAIKTSEPEKKPEEEVTEESRSITPPKIDTEKIKNDIATRLNSQYGRQDSPGIVDSDEEIDEELNELLKLRSNKSASVVEGSPEVYNFDQDYEKKRKYVIRITSKLPSPDNQVLEVDFGTKGLKTFEKILKAAVDYFKKALANKLSPIYLFSYDPLLVSLVWVEGKKLIQPFFTPRTLRIAPPGDFNPLIDDIEKVSPTMVRFFLIPKEYSQTFMNIYPEFQAIKPIDDVPEPVEVPEENSSSSDEEEEIVPAAEEASPLGVSADQPVEIEEDDDAFVIGLKGKDNKRVEVKVTPETKLRNLLSYYLKQKGLSEDTVDVSRAKLIFDDEELNLDETVGDTELEEDFEIQVKL
ncbi:Protein ESC2 [Candida viswanathii]|uniref:Protein ESC2 n=1 Tax=Candida viswanathii TaxID=5486 RepID=A0A367XR74_9ASCO|nr:Protein ESC2 [Candida viswanathii]